MLEQPWEKGSRLCYETVGTCSVGGNSVCYQYEEECKEEIRDPRPALVDYSASNFFLVLQAGAENYRYCKP